MTWTEKQIWSAACGMLDGYGPRAVEASQRRARDRLGADDVVAHGAWLLVAEACREMLRSRVAERLH